MAATDKDSLELLHRLVTQAYSTEIALALKDEAPPNPALLAGAAKFLKDNEITADPADKKDLKEMQRKLKEASAQRKSRKSNVSDMLAHVTNDMKEA